jgi:hypothetical protein
MIVLLILLVICSVWYILHLNSKPSTPSIVDTQAYTLEQLKGMNLKSLEDLAKKKVSVIHVMNNEEIKIDDKTTLVLTIENDKLVGVKDKITSAENGGSGEGRGEPQSIKDRDKDGISDAQDKCPDDPDNNCGTRPSPKIPLNVKPFGNNLYGVQSQMPEESVLDFHRRIRASKEILELGEIGRICSPSEICRLNRIATENEKIQGGIWVKFEVY